jgi:predicted secreted protein
LFSDELRLSELPQVRSLFFHSAFICILVIVPDFGGSRTLFSIQSSEIVNAYMRSPTYQILYSELRE